VRNAGNVNLTITSLEDDQIGPLGPSSYVSGDDGDNVFEPGETWVFAANGTAVPGNYANVGTVNATHGPTGAEVTASDPSSYLGIAPSIVVKKYVKDATGNWQVRLWVG
jgi:hypothetical protein